MRDIILAAYLERAYQNDLVAYRQHFSRRQWLRSEDGTFALNKFDRIWPTFWIAKHPVAA
jgi:hypothetical protein